MRDCVFKLLLSKVSCFSKKLKLFSFPSKASKIASDLTPPPHFRDEARACATNKTLYLKHKTKHFWHYFAFQSVDWISKFQESCLESEVVLIIKIDLWSLFLGKDFQEMSLNVQCDNNSEFHICLRCGILLKACSLLTPRDSRRADFLLHKVTVKILWKNANLKSERERGRGRGRERE